MTIFTIIDNESCFGGFLSELVFCADRTYMINNALLDNNKNGPFISLCALNFKSLEMVNGQTRLETRFNSNTKKLKASQRIRKEFKNDSRRSPEGFKKE